MTKPSVITTVGLALLVVAVLLLAEITRAHSPDCPTDWPEMNLNAPVINELHHTDGDGNQWVVFGNPPIVRAYPVSDEFDEGYIPSTAHETCNWHLARNEQIFFPDEEEQGDATTQGLPGQVFQQPVGQVSPVTGLRTAASMDSNGNAECNGTVSSVVVSKDGKPVTNLNLTEGNTYTYTVVLSEELEDGIFSARPDGVVGIGIISSNPDKVWVSPTGMLFDGGMYRNHGAWDETQTVTVEALEDDNTVGETVTITHTITLVNATLGTWCLPEGTQVRTVTVTVNDDD